MPATLHFVRLGNNRIVRPTTETATHLREEAHKHLLQSIQPGAYTDTATVNAALQRVFEFYSARLTRLIEQLASRDFIQCLLFQYEESVAIGHGDQLDASQREFWRGVGQRFRRAVKFLCEKACLAAQRANSDLSQKKSVKLFDQALYCAEEMVHLYHLSETTYSLFPDTVELKLTKKSLDVLLRGTHAQALPQFVRTVEQDRNNRSRFIKGLSFDTDPVAHCAILDSGFEKAFGLPFMGFLDFLKHAIDDPKEHTSGFPIPFINLEGLVQAGTGYGLKADLVRRILSGFTLWKAAMQKEARVIWNPKQKHRALRRAFFEFPHPTGTHIVWSRGMAKESFVWLLSGVCFQCLPEEWVAPETNTALAATSNACGAWFEKVAAENLRAIGFNGSAFKNQVRVGQETLDIPASVGQLDFLGYSSQERLLLLAEFKIVEEGTEPKFYRDSVAQFVRNKGNYADKFRTKIAWLRENRTQLGQIFSKVEHRVRLAIVMVTLYPSFASFFIDDFPCVSITHLRLAH
jgi:hypothetical protein